MMPQRTVTLESNGDANFKVEGVQTRNLLFFRCLFDRNHSKLRSLARLPESEDFIKSQVGLLFALTNV